MCKLCDERVPPSHSASRRDFLKAAAATGAAVAAGPALIAARPAAADGGSPPPDSGRPGRRYIIGGGSVLSMDPKVGDFAQADVLVQGKKILAVGPNLHAGDADVIDARGRIVMPGFIDTHHHQFETALRSFLTNGILINDGSGTLSRTRRISSSSCSRSRPYTVRRTSTSASCSAGWPSSMTASPRSTTSRRSTTRRSTRTPPSRPCSTRGAAPPSAISRARGPRSSAPIPGTNTRTTRSVSRNSGSPRRTSSSA